MMKIGLVMGLYLIRGVLVSRLILAACYFYDKGFNAENIEVYTFGAPPVASQEFVDHFVGKFPVYRIVNHMDFIPVWKVSTQIYFIWERKSHCPQIIRKCIRLVAILIMY
jgi:hypothetical protein